MKNFILVILLSWFFIVGFQTAGEEPGGWQTVFKYLIMGVIALAGAPVTQLIKNWLGKIKGQPVEDRWAVIVTVGVCAALATLDLMLAGTLGLQDFTVQTFPDTFWRIIAVASIYYGFMKGSESFFGRGALLKKPI